jgi:hypothetical protein
VSELTRIPERTLNDWSMQPWFGTMLAELRAERASELDGTYTRIIDEATGPLLDRLKNGDPYTVGGEVKRKPVSARDLALIAAITYDKRALARHEPTQIGIKRDENYLPGLCQGERGAGEARLSRLTPRRCSACSYRPMFSPAPCLGSLILVDPRRGPYRRNLGGWGEQRPTQDGRCFR